jgi:urea transport system permease protein
MMWRSMAAAACAAAVLAIPVFAQSSDEQFAATLGELRDGGFAAKEATVGRLAAGGHPSARAVLTALLDDRLFVRGQDQALFIVKSADAGLTSFELVDPVSRRDAGSAPREAMAPTIRREIETGLALGALDGADAEARVAAAAALSQRMTPDVRNRLAKLLDRGDGGDFAEPDAAVRQAAVRALKAIDGSRAMYSAIEMLFFGLSLGSVLVLAAIGLAITFGVMGVITMAHGELIMLGAYTTYVVQLAMPHAIGVSILVAIPAAFLVAGAAGVMLERTIIRFFYGRRLETLLATFGVSLILQQFVRSIFSANNRAVETPGWMSGSWQINEALALQAMPKKSRLGSRFVQSRRIGPWLARWASRAPASTR